LIVARGGGSLEDLWTFNEEAVARAIAACSVPVVSAVGHETDFTIADFVADLRAATPSAAAELVVGLKEDLQTQVAGAEGRLLQAVRYRLATVARRLHQQGIDRASSLLHREIGRNQQRIDDCGYRMRAHLASMIEARRRRVRALETRLRDFDPRPRLARNRARHQTLDTSLVHRVRSQIDRRKGRIEALTAKLSQMSPLTVLQRGYAIVTRADGRVLMNSADAPVGSEIDIRLNSGRLGAKVTRGD
jgi:exodeoxyribonuclease VII large subunit